MGEDLGIIVFRKYLPCGNQSGPCLIKDTRYRLFSLQPSSSSSFSFLCYFFHFSFLFLIFSFTLPPSPLSVFLLSCLFLFPLPFFFTLFQEDLHVPICLWLYDLGLPGKLRCLPGNEKAIKEASWSTTRKHACLATTCTISKQECYAAIKNDGPKNYEVAQKQLICYV